MKKRQSSPNASLLLLVFITKQQLGVLNMNILSHSQQPVSRKQPSTEFAPAICGRALAYECDETEQIRISSVLFLAA